MYVNWNFIWLWLYRFPPVPVQSLAVVRVVCWSFKNNNHAANKRRPNQLTTRQPSKQKSKLKSGLNSWLRTTFHTGRNSHCQYNIHINKYIYIFFREKLKFLRHKMTLKIALCTKDDLDEAIKLQKREQYEEERKLRIFNAKERLFGVNFTLFST